MINPFNSLSASYFIYILLMFIWNPNKWEYNSIIENRTAERSAETLFSKDISVAGIGLSLTPYSNQNCLHVVFKRHICCRDWFELNAIFESELLVRCPTCVLSKRCCSLITLSGTLLYISFMYVCIGTWFICFVHVRVYRHMVYMFCSCACV